MKRQRLPKGSSRKKESRLIIAHVVAMPTKHHSAIYNYLHEAGHDIERFDASAHRYLDELGHKMKAEGHKIHMVYDVLNSKDNYADFRLMPGRNPEHRRVTMEGAESVIHKMYPQAKIEWGLDPGAKVPLENTSIIQDLRVSNVSLGDLITINNALMQYGGGFK
jgi:hypothetical protein